MSNLLDPAEMEALRAAQSTSQPREVQPVHLIGQDSRLRGSLNLLARTLVPSAEEIERVFVKLRQKPQRVEIAPLETAPPKQAVGLLRSAGAVCVLHAGATLEDAYLLVDEGLCFELTDRSFGGSGVPGPEGPGPISPLMRQNACELAEVVCKMLDGCRASLWPSLTVKGPITRIDAIAHALADRDCVVVRWVIQAPDTTLTLVLPSGLLTLPQRVLKPSNDATVLRQITEHIAEVETQLQVELGRSVIPLDQLLKLAPGDVIRLDRGTSEPLIVRTEGLSLFEAKPNAVAEHVGLVLENWIWSD